MTKFYCYLVSFKRRVNFECGDYRSMYICTTFVGNESNVHLRGTVSMQILKVVRKWHHVLLKTLE